MPAEGDKPWDPHPKENIQWWRWFVIYRDMQPKRSLAKTARIAGKSSAWIEKLSTQWGWAERCQAWDAQMALHVSRMLDGMQADAVEAMRKRHINLGMGMQTAAAKELQAWVHKIDAAEAKAKEAAIAEGRDPTKAYHEPVLTIGELIRLANEGTGLERINRGEPTEVTRVEVDENGLDRLTAEELRQLKRLKEKLGGSA